MIMFWKIWSRKGTSLIVRKVMDLNTKGGQSEIKIKREGVKQINFFFDYPGQVKTLECETIDWSLEAIAGLCINLDGSVVWLGIRQLHLLSIKACCGPGKPHKCLSGSATPLLITSNVWLCTANGIGMQAIIPGVLHGSQWLIVLTCCETDSVSIVLHKPGSEAGGWTQLLLLLGF